MSKRVQATLVVLLVYLWLVVRDWWVAEDAYITFRYARNWAAGHGPRFNPGVDPPVEGYSNFLWLVYCTLLEWMGWSPILGAPLLSLLTGVAAVLLVMSILLDDLELPLLTSCLASLALVTSAPFVTWTTSGLASMPLTALLLAAFVGVVRAQGTTQAIMVGVVGAALCLVRTEGPAWWLIALVAGSMARRQGTIVPTALAVSMPVVCAHLFWRHATYDAWVSNTAKAKVSLSWPVLLRGLRYDAEFVVATLLPSAGLLGAVLGWRERPRWVLALSAGLGGTLAYGALVGGDYMADFRLLVPGVPFAACLFALFLERARAWGPAVPGVAWALVLIMGAAPLWSVNLLPWSMREAMSTDQREDRPAHGRVVKPNAKLKGRVLADYARPGDSLVTVAIGKLGYYAPQVFLHDRNGLVNREVAEREVEDLRRPGHDKLVPASFFYASRPTMMGFTVVEDGPKAARQIDAAIRSMKPRDPKGRYAPDVKPIEQRDGSTMWAVALRLSEKPREGWRAYDKQLAALKKRARGTHR